ncbi:MAG: AI-2E family transporter [Acidimicrobiia bacterium]
MTDRVPVDRIRRAGQIAWALIGIAVVIAILGLIAWVVRVIWPPLILAGAIVFLLNPVVTWLQRRGMPRAAGAGVAYLGVIGLLVVAGVLLAPVIGDQSAELSEEMPEIQERIERWVDDRAKASEGTFYEFSRSELENAFSGEDTGLRSQLESAFEVGVQVFHALLIIVLAPIIAFYLLVDVPRLMEVADELVPERARDEVHLVVGRLNRAIGGFFRGQLLVAVIVGLIVSVGLGIIGLKFWFLVGMIAGLFNIIPLIGPYIGAIPGIVIALTTGSPFQALLVIAIMVGAQQVDNHFITPQVMQRAVHLHPALVMLALLAGGTLLGFLGLLFAVPGAAVVKILIGHAWRTYILGEPLEVVELEHAVDDAEGSGVVETVGDEPENR